MSKSRQMEFFKAARSPYVVKQTGVAQWTVGYYRPNNRWVAVSNHNSGATAGVVASGLNEGKR